LNVLEIIGRRALGALKGLSGMSYLTVDTVVEMADHAAHRRAPFHARLLFTQTRRVGVGSIPLVALVSLFLGLTTAILVSYQLERLGAEQSVPAFIAISFTREMGALLTGIVVAARSGAAFTAELGTMTVSEEVDAIEGMGVGAMRYLVAPRVLASMLMLPSLSVVANLAGLAGGALVARWELDMSLPHFAVLAMDSLVSHDIVAGLIKSLLFGLIIGLIACYQGLAATQGATGVGLATTSSVVLSVTSVIGCDTLCNIVLVRVWP
jgi:phospholipid/cholesterol/gamma-HCH transport system permease protein